MLKACTVCGSLSSEFRCPLHRRAKNAHWSKERNRSAQDRFRRAVLKLYGGQCAAIENGARCPRISGLQAHHTQPGNDDPATGVLLCEEHHAAIDPKARVSR